MIATLLVIEEAGASNYQQQKSIYLLEDKLMNNLTKVVSNWPSGFGEEDYKWITPFLTLISRIVINWPSLSVSFYILIFFSETTGPIGLVLGKNIH
jgi:hypothetical protein